MASPVEEALERLGPVDDLLERSGHPVRHGMAQCVSGTHDDHDPSMHVYPGRNGKQLVCCFACEFKGDAIDVARALGIRVELGKPAKPKPARPRPKPTPAQRDLTRILNRREAIAFEVAAALALARIHRDAAMQEVERNRLWLQEQGSVELIVELSDRLRSWLFERYGIPSKFVWSQETVWAGFEELAGGS